MKYKYSIPFSLAATLFFSYWYENYNIQDNVIVFLGMVTMCNIWSYWMNKSKPTFLTKDSDEILHPVTENTTILHICNIEKHYGKKYNKKFVETCECGSTLFRIYNEDTPKGTFIQFICTKCNLKATGLEFDWKPKNKQ